MKSLKRTLSLVLVLAMVLGLMGFASAASFTDAAKVQYNEAVGVMTGIGAINGYTDGSFNPAGTITREEAAKLVAYTVLGATTAKTLSVTATGFSDVAATRWSAPFIAYCVNAGIINGMGDGTFAPTANVTGYQLAKMLLCALGYGKKGEFTGTAWELETAILATSTGIFDDAKTVSFSVAATREEAALYCFNALFIQKVAYSKDTDSYVGVTATSVSTFDYRSRTTTVPVTIASSVYPSLYKSDDVTADDYGRPAATWYYKDKIIAQITDTPIYTTTTAVLSSTLKTTLANQGYTFGTYVEQYTNGYYEPYASVSDLFSTTYVGANGLKIELYADEDDVITTLVVVNTYLAGTSASALVADDATTTTVDERSITMQIPGGHYFTAYAYNPVTKAKTPGFDAAWAAVAYQLSIGTKAYVLVVPYLDNTENSYAMAVGVPVFANGAISAYTGTTSLTVGGKAYGYSLNAVMATVSPFLNSSNITAATPMNLILDSYGYLLAASGVTATPNYAYVIDAANGAGLDASTNYAKLLLADGTVKTVTATALPTKKTLVTYTVNSTTGVYTLSSALDTAVEDTSFAITQGVTAMTGFETDPVYANANTIFLIGTTTSGVTSYTMVKGIANVSTFSGKSGDLLGYVVNSTTGYADIVFVQDATVGGTTTAAPTYIYKDSSAATTDATGTYYTYNAIVNGAITTVKVAGGVLDSGANVCSAVTYTSGIVTAVTPVDSTYVVSSANAGTTAAANGVIKLGSTPYSYSSTAVVYYVNYTTNVITASSIATLASDSNDGFTAVLSSGGVVTAVYVVSK